MADTNTESRTRWVLRLAIAILLGFVTSPFWGGKIVDLWRDHEVSLDITDPKNGATVSRLDTVSGRIRDIPDNRELWVIVQVQEEGNGYYPQGAVEQSGDGSWYCIVGFGSPSSDEDGNKYKVYAALAKPEQNDKMREWMQNGLSNATEGMPGYPSDELEHVTSVNVTRSASDDPTTEGVVDDTGCNE